jgi:Flp pilus assembly protein CpaB
MVTDDHRGRSRRSGRRRGRSPIGSDTQAARRIINPARALPNGRAALGGLLVAVAALGSYLLATGDRSGPTTRYAVATRDLQPGYTLNANDVHLVSLDLPAEQASGTFSSTAQLHGAVARGPLQAGAIVTASAIERPAAADAGTNYRELSMTLAADRAVGGTLRPGDRVDVVATANGASYVLVQRATVLAAGTGRNTNPLSSGEITITLALPDATTALAVTHGAAAAELTLLRSSRATTPLPESFRLPASPPVGATGLAGTGTAVAGATAAGTTTGERRG